MYATTRDAFCILIRRRKSAIASHSVAERGHTKGGGQLRYIVTLTSCHASLR